jgi:hypothetical protein
MRLLGLKPALILGLYAALKRRSSTVLLARLDVACPNMAAQGKMTAQLS